MAEIDCSPEAMAHKIVEENPPHSCAACGAPWPNLECGHRKNAEDFREAIPCVPSTENLVSAIASALAQAVKERDEARAAMNAALQRVSYLSTSKLGFVEALDACQRGLELRQTLADKERARRAQSPGIDFATPPIMRRFIEST